MSFQEKSVWGSLVVTIAAAGYYFWTVFAADGLADGRWIIGLGIGVIVLIVFAEVAYQVVLALVSKDESDERDRLIEAYAVRNGYYILITGLFMLIGHLAIQLLLGKGPWLTMDVPTVVLYLVFAIVVAEITLSVSKLVYYRLGIG